MITNSNAGLTKCFLVIIIYLLWIFVFRYIQSCNCSETISNLFEMVKELSKGPQKVNLDTEYVQEKTQHLRDLLAAQCGGGVAIDDDDDSDESAATDDDDDFDADEFISVFI